MNINKTINKLFAETHEGRKVISIAALLQIRISVGMSISAIPTATICHIAKVNFIGVMFITS